jgi:glycosyltransferase involved in cell wall biosynthesis
MEASLRRRIAELVLEGVATRAPFTHVVSAVMSALDVLVHPALGTDAAPLVVWEALASGRPVIASRLDGIPEAFEEGRHGLLVPPGDIAALAAAMERMVTSPEARALRACRPRARCSRGIRAWRRPSACVSTSG